MSESEYEKEQQKYDDYWDGVEEPECHYCCGGGYILLDLDTIDDPVNMCDWASGGELGDIVKCRCCGGSGKAEDCRWW